MSLCLGAPWQNVLLLQLLLARSVPQFDVQGVSSADLNSQRTSKREKRRRVSHRLLRTWKLHIYYTFSVSLGSLHRVQPTLTTQITASVTICLRQLED